MGSPYNVLGAAHNQLTAITSKDTHKIKRTFQYV